VPYPPNKRRHDVAPYFGQVPSSAKSSGTVAVVDWTDEDNGRSPANGRRVPEATIWSHLSGAGFKDLGSHQVYEFHQFIASQI